MATVVMASTVRILTNVLKEATTAITMPLAETLMDRDPALAILILVGNAMMPMSVLLHSKVTIVAIVVCSNNDVSLQIIKNATLRNTTVMLAHSVAVVFCSFSCACNDEGTGDGVTCVAYFPLTVLIDYLY